MLLIRIIQLFYATLIIPHLCSALNSTYLNPIIPGWNSDPSCILVKKWDNTFFCTTSSFLLFPGIPLYASKDLINWRLVSNALNRPEQLPELSYNGQQSEGIWASTIRFRNGTFYLITTYVSWGTGWKPQILLFTTTDPYDDAAWSDPVRIENPANDIDPDLFWDDDGKVYMAVAAGIYISEIDILTGKATEPFKVWNGTGDRNPEGPHLYKKDNYYYLLIGEGGTETNHSVTIARSRNIRGPYDGYVGNPILTAKNTNNYFQTVGHADLFQDASDNWWAVVLATRSGPSWEVYPMGRETILVPARWDKGEWPILDTVLGKMSGPLPLPNKAVYGDGSFISNADRVNFAPGSSLPKHFGFWRPPKTSLFSISPPGHPNTLRIFPSRVNLTADAGYEPVIDGLGFVARRQTSSLFHYSVDIEFAPKVAGEEAGVSVFLTQFQHIDLGIINIPGTSGQSPVLSLRFRVEASGKPSTTTPELFIQPIPNSWKGVIRLSITATENAQYVLSAAPTSRLKDVIVVGTANAAVVSGGSGPFTGTLIGAYVTSNGGNGSTPAFFSRWRYTPVAQEIAEGVFVPA